MLDGLAEWVITVVETLGYVGVAALVALENLFPPIPSEVVLPLAGFVAATGEASLPGMILAATIGSLTGAVILYTIAAAIGPHRLRRAVARHGRWLRIEVADLDRTEAWFDRRAGIAVLVCRCIPLIRSLISIPAGFRRMPIGPFLLYTALGSLVWNVLLVGAGYLLGEQWERVEAPLDLLQGLVIALIVAAIVWFVWARMLRPRLRRGG
ncbi:MAG: DedA family protein [Actinobacteria bacterium]|nr:DedA family protein [Actinomycetota bacterium]